MSRRTEVIREIYEKKNFLNTKEKFYIIIKKEGEMLRIKRWGVTINVGKGRGEMYENTKKHR